MNVIAVIGARLNSSRLAGKHLLPLAGKPLIERLVERLKQCDTLTHLTLATTADAYNRPLVDWTKDHIRCSPYQGDVNDLMGRIDSVVQGLQPDILVYICGDCPLIAPDFIDYSVNKLIENPDYDTLELYDHVESIHEGMHFYRREGWVKLMQHSQTAMEKEHVGYANKQKNFLKILKVDDCDNYAGVKQRISVDTPADYAFMQSIYQSWYKTHAENSIVSLKWVMKQLMSDKQLAQINAHVMQKKPDHHYQKVSLFCHVDPSIGMGHLKRCALIATTLQETFGLGTQIYICGEARECGWLQGQFSWLKNEQQLFTQMEMDQSQAWILDFHPAYIDQQQLKNMCKNIKNSRKLFVMAMDKMNGLLDVVDQLFIPSFYTALSSDKISSGWENYILSPATVCEKSNQITLLTGGSDALGYGEILPNILKNKIPQSWSVEWIQGPYAKPPILCVNKHEGTGEAGGIFKQWHLHHHPENLAQIIAASKIIITCYGLMLMEAMQSGASVILLPVKGLTSEAELSVLREAKCCFIADDIESIPRLLTNLFENNPLDMQYKRNAKRLLSGIQGAKKIGALCMQYFES